MHVQLEGLNWAAVPAVSGPRRQIIHTPARRRLSHHLVPANQLCSHSTTDTIANLTTSRPLPPQTSHSTTHSHLHPQLSTEPPNMSVPAFADISKSANDVSPPLRPRPRPPSTACWELPSLSAARVLFLRAPRSPRFIVDVNDNSKVETGGLVTRWASGSPHTSAARKNWLTSSSSFARHLVAQQGLLPPLGWYH